MTYPQQAAWTMTIIFNTMSYAEGTAKIETIPGLMQFTCTGSGSTRLSKKVVYDYR